MSHIKKFIDQVSYLESRPGKDLVIPASEARMLRDEICRILLDKVSNQPVQSTEQIVLNGGTFK